MEVRANRSVAVPAVPVVVSRDALFAIGGGRDATRVDPDVGWHVERTAVPVVAVEAVDIGTVLDRSGEIDLFTVAAPVPTEVPFAHHRRVVTDRTHQVTKRWALGWNQVIARAAEHAASEAASPIVSTGQQSVTRGRADRAGCMRVEKRDSLVRHLLQSGCLDLAIGIRRRNVADPEVVGHDNDHVG